MVIFLTDALRSAGIDFTLTDAGVDVGAATLVPISSDHLPPLAELERLTPTVGVGVLVVPYMSKPAGERCLNAGWSWIDKVGNAEVRAPGLTMSRRSTTRAPDKKRNTRLLPSGPHSWMIIRLLIQDPNSIRAKQTELAERAGVTQAWVSKVLAKLTSSGLVTGKRLDRTVDRPGLLRAFVQEYPGPGGTVLSYYSLNAPATTATAIADALGPDIRISGDVAADAIAPVRVPTTLRAYVKSEAQFHAQRFDLLEAVGDEGNVTITIPSDKSVFFSDSSWADLAQTAWDLSDEGGSDRLQALEALVNTIQHP